MSNASFKITEIKRANDFKITEIKRASDFKLPRFDSSLYPYVFNGSSFESIPENNGWYLRKKSQNEFVTTYVSAQYLDADHSDDVYPGRRRPRWYVYIFMESDSDTVWWNVSINTATLENTCEVCSPTGGSRMCVLSIENVRDMLEVIGLE